MLDIGVAGREFFILVPLGVLSAQHEGQSPIIEYLLACRRSHHVVCDRYRSPTEGTRSFSGERRPTRTVVDGSQQIAGRKYKQLIFGNLQYQHSADGRVATARSRNRTISSLYFSRMEPASSDR